MNRHLLALAFCCATPGPLATRATAGEQPKGPLAALPSKPGPHVARIEALGDNAWLNLGPPAADPAWGKAAPSSAHTSPSQTTSSAPRIQPTIA